MPLSSLKITDDGNVWFPGVSSPGAPTEATVNQVPRHPPLVATDPEIAPTYSLLAPVLSTVTVTGVVAVGSVCG